MRIIGSIDHPKLKITVFSMDSRLSVKLENGLYEQLYRFRQGEGVETVADVQTLLDAAFLEEVERVFAQMHRLRCAASARLQAAGAADEFDEII